jgi:hypothetical protein
VNGKAVVSELGCCMMLARTLQVGDIVGVRALAVHAKDDDAISFYRHFGFMPSNTDPRHLFMLIKDIRAIAGD